jgi:hypothetical protein
MLISGNIMVDFGRSRRFIKDFREPKLRKSRNIFVNFTETIDIWKEYKYCNACFCKRAVLAARIWCVGLNP